MKLASLRKYLTKRHLIYIYILFLIFSFFYVKKILNTDLVEVSETKEESPVEEVHPADVTLKVYETPQTKIYTAKLKTSDTIDDLFDYLRKQNKLTYQKLNYDYGTEYSSIDNIFASEKQKWKIYVNNNDITYSLNKFNLTDGMIIEAKLVTTR